MQVQVQMTGECSSAARAAPSKQKLMANHSGPLTRSRLAATAVEVRTGKCTGPRATQPRGPRVMVRPAERAALFQISDSCQ